MRYIYIYIYIYITHPLYSGGYSAADLLVLYRVRPWIMTELERGDERQQSGGWNSVSEWLTDGSMAGSHLCGVKPDPRLPWSCYATTWETINSATHGKPVSQKMAPLWVQRAPTCPSPSFVYHNVMLGLAWPSISLLSIAVSDYYTDDVVPYGSADRPITLSWCMYVCVCVCVCVVHVSTIKRKPLIGMTWNLAP